jgi:hypothetical protein
VTDSPVRWSLVPLLAAGGLASSIYTLYFPWRLGDSSNAGYGLFLVLGSILFGLTLLAGLWYRRHVQSWRRAAALVAVVVVAHLLNAGLTLQLSAVVARQVDLPIRGRAFLIGPVGIFVVGWTIIVGVLVLVFPKRHHSRTLWIAAGCAAALSIAAAYREAANEGAWLALWNAEPLWPFWQTGMAAAVGLGLCVGDAALPRTAASMRDGLDSGVVPARRLAAFGVLVVYSIALALFCQAVQLRRGDQLRRREARSQADIARSLTEAPSAALPMVAPRPIREMLLMEIDGVWTPDSARWWNQSIERAVPGASPALPHRIAYGARYGRKNSDDLTSVGVTVTEFPSADWARYQLRNTPNANAFFEQREQLQTWHRGGDSVYQLGTTCFWSSGRVLVAFDISGVPQRIVDMFLDAYLAKYPSSIHEG